MDNKTLIRPKKCYQLKEKQFKTHILKLYILRFNKVDSCKRVKPIFLLGKPSEIVMFPAGNSAPIPDWKVYSRVNFPNLYLQNLLSKSTCKNFHLILFFCKIRFRCNEFSKCIHVLFLKA